MSIYIDKNLTNKENIYINSSIKLIKRILIFDDRKKIEKQKTQN